MRRRRAQGACGRRAPQPRHAPRLRVDDVSHVVFGRFGFELRLSLCDSGFGLRLRLRSLGFRGLRRLRGAPCARNARTFSSRKSSYVQRDAAERAAHPTR